MTKKMVPMKITKIINGGRTYKLKLYPPVRKGEAPRHDWVRDNPPAIVGAEVASLLDEIARLSVLDGKLVEVDR